MQGACLLRGSARAVDEFLSVGGVPAGLSREGKPRVHHERSLRHVDLYTRSEQ
jgi:hypothetical protein